MAEKKIGVFPDVLLGPWFGKSYDLIITEQRLLLVHVATFGTKWKPFYEKGRDISVYDRESIDVLAGREGSISVLFMTIRKIGMKKAHVAEPAWYYLIVNHEDPYGKMKKLKIMLFSPFRDQGQREFAMEVQTSLEKSLPPDIRQSGSWLF